jgi:hypothetical protein
MKSITCTLALLAVTVLSTFNVNAGLTPTYPDGSTIVHPGDEMTILWKESGEAPALDKLGNVAVKFMTGADLNQKELKVIGTVDAIVGQLKWVIPVVAPAGKIYFIRFEAGQNQYFTTRFIITDVNGQYPPPPNPPPPVGKNQGGDGTIVSDAPNAGGANNTNTTSPNPTPNNPYPSTNSPSPNTDKPPANNPTTNTPTTNSPTTNNTTTNNPTNNNSNTSGSNTTSTNNVSLSTRTIASKGLSFGAVVGGMAVGFLAFGGSFI